jgi:putative transcriptional regulator
MSFFVRGLHHARSGDTHNFQRGKRNPMKSAGITKKNAENASRGAGPWAPLDAMSQEEKHEAALSDPDAQPQTPDRLARKKRTPQVKIVRRALGLSQEEFAACYRIPLGTLRDWEQGRSVPDAPGRAYLRVTRFG